jgi:hypothetical protein
MHANIFYVIVQKHVSVEAALADFWPESQGAPLE